MLLQTIVNCILSMKLHLEKFWLQEIQIKRKRKIYFELLKTLVKNYHANQANQENRA